MGITVIGPTLATYPTIACTPLLDLKPAWSSPWYWIPELRLVRGSVVTASQGLSSVQVSAPYGAIKHPWQPDFAVRGSVSLRGCWLRLRLVGSQGPQTVFIGRISTETREVQGADVARSGQQSWTAYGPEQLLQKIHVGRSFWVHPTLGYSDTAEIGWVPSVNDRDDRGMLVGNRAIITGPDDVYEFGDTMVWSHYDLVEYLLAKFVTEDGTAGPKWTIGGQIDVLKSLQTVIPMSATHTAADILRELIPPKLGVDYRIRNTPDGFQVFVFALTAIPYSFRGKTIPQNPNTVRIRAGQSKSLVRTVVEQTDDWKFSKIRILGRRAVICCSLGGSKCPITEIADTLEPKWDSALESKYKQGEISLPGFPDPEVDDHDRVRRDDRFATVYSHFGAPADWDRATHGTAPGFKPDGDFDSANPADYQLQVRQTETWTPLKVGFDYSQDPPVDENPPGYTPEFSLPCAYLSGPQVSHLPGISSYDRADQVGIGVSVPQHEWGLVLHASPNHLLADGHWTGANPSNVKPLYDYDYTVITIALEADQRPVAEMTIPGDPPPSAGVMEIEDDGIECWLLAPYTVLGIGHFAQLEHSGATVRVLRDDAERIGQVMAGALARYYQTRARAEITAEGLLAWTGLLGQVLSTVEQAGDVAQVQAPITSIDWSVEEEGTTQTIIRTGYAQ